MRLEKPRHQIRGRVKTEIGRQIGNANSPVIVARTLPMRRARRRELSFNGQPGASKLILTRRRNGEKRERQDVQLSLPHRGNDMRDIGLVIGPIAKVQLRRQPAAFDAGRVRLERQRLRIGIERLLVTLGVLENIAAAKPGIGQVRLLGERRVISGQRFVIAIEIEEGVAAAERGFSKVRIVRERLGVGVEGLVVTLEKLKDVPKTKPSVGEARFGRQRQFISGERLIVPVELA